MISMEREGNAARSRRPKLARSAATITMAPTRPSARPTSISSPPAGPVTAASPAGWLVALVARTRSRQEEGKGDREAGRGIRRAEEEIGEGHNVELERPVHQRVVLEAQPAVVVVGVVHMRDLIVAHHAGRKHGKP